MLYCAQYGCCAVCPTEVSGRDLEDRCEVAVKVRANLCQGWPSNCTRCLRKGEKREGRERDDVGGG
jgi:hypothetical protein